MDLVSIVDLALSAGGLGIGCTIIYRLGALGKAVTNIEKRLESLEHWRNEVISKFFRGGV